MTTVRRSRYGLASGPLALLVLSQRLPSPAAAAPGPATRARHVMSRPESESYRLKNASDALNSGRPHRFKAFAESDWLSSCNSALRVTVTLPAEPLIMIQV